MEGPFSGLVKLTKEVGRRSLAPAGELRDGLDIEIPQRRLIRYHAGLDQLHQQAIAETVDLHRTA